MRISLANKKEQGALSLQEALLIPRDLDGIQTHDLQNRNLTLYSAKLQGQVITIYNVQFTMYNLQRALGVLDKVLRSVLSIASAQKPLGRFLNF